MNNEEYCIRCGKEIEVEVEVKAEVRVKTKPLQGFCSDCYSIVYEEQ